MRAPPVDRLLGRRAALDDVDPPEEGVVAETYVTEDGPWAVLVVDPRFRSCWDDGHREVPAGMLRLLPERAGDALSLLLEAMVAMAVREQGLGDLLPIEFGWDGRPAVAPAPTADGGSPADAQGETR